jgi:chromate transporter
LFNLVLYLAFSVLLPTKQFNSFDWAAAAWVIISFFALHKYKANLIVWLGISLIFGLVNYWLL